MASCWTTRLRGSRAAAPLNSFSSQSPSLSLASAALASSFCVELPRPEVPAAMKSATCAASWSGSHTFRKDAGIAEVTIGLLVLLLQDFQDAQIAAHLLDRFL